MKKLSLIYYSARRRTEHIAKHIAAGAEAVAGINVRVLKAADLGASR